MTCADNQQGSVKVMEMEERLSYVDHNELIDVRVSVLVEPAVSERHVLCDLFSLVIPPLTCTFKGLSAHGAPLAVLFLSFSVLSI